MKEIQTDKVAAMVPAIVLTCPVCETGKLDAVENSVLACLKCNTRYTFEIHLFTGGGVTIGT